MTCSERLAPIQNFADGGRDAGGKRLTDGRAAQAAKDDEPVTASIMRQVLSVVTEDVLRHQRELQNQQLEFLQKQQEQFALLTQAVLRAQQSSTSAPAARERAAATEPTASAGSLSTGEGSTDSPETMTTPRGIRTLNQTLTAGGMIKWLATQIPEFGEGEEDNVTAWVRRVEKAAQIHGASDGVTLLAASSRLVRAAKR